MNSVESKETSLIVSGNANFETNKELTFIGIQDVYDLSYILHKALSGITWLKEV